MAKKRFKIKGTKDFLVAAVACLFLCLWAVKDAWLPSAKVLEKHPQSLAVSMEVSGVIKSMPMKVGDDIKGEAILATIYDTSYQTAFDEAAVAFKAVDKEDAVVKEEKAEALLEARVNLAACTLKNTDVHITLHDLDSTLHGEVLEWPENAGPEVRPGMKVEAGQPVLFVRPPDTFYIFNQSLAIITFLGMIISLVFHRLASI